MLDSNFVSSNHPYSIYSYLLPKNYYSKTNIKLVVNLKAIQRVQTPDIYSKVLKL